MTAKSAKRGIACDYASAADLHALSTGVRWWYSWGEALAKATGVKLVGPAITWGTLAGYSDPVVWMDVFIAAYQAANAGAPPAAFLRTQHGLRRASGRRFSSGWRKVGAPLFT